MTSAELKSKELIDRFKVLLILSDTDAGEEITCTILAKQCALIAVEEIYKTNLIFGRYEYEENPEFFYSYWEEVKTEIEKL